MKKVKTFLSLMLSLVVLAANAQNVVVKGTVTDVNGEPLVGATVLVAGSSNGAVTDASGSYSVVATKNGVLTAAFIGYSEVTTPIEGRTKIDFVLTEDSNYLDEVTVVAYGAKRKQDLVGSVSSVKSDAINNTQAASLSSALEGAVAGLTVVTTTGQPGEDASIYVRGISSLSASNDALIVLDGAPYNGSLSSINPADIESITVSKDAVSNSLYGSRASGGVVMITTKTGKKDKLTIRLNANVGVVSRAYKDYDYVTSNKEFYELTWYGLRNTAMFAGATEADAAQYASEKLLGEVGNYNAFIIPEGQYLVGLNGKLNSAAKVRYDDSFADAMFQTSVRQNYDVSASGGTDKTDYYMSLGFLDNKSYIIGSDFQRITARLNVNTQLTKWLKAGMSAGFGRATQNGLQESSSAASNPFHTARSWAPIYPVHAYDALGNQILDEKGNPIYDAGTGQTAGTSARPTATNQNVICNLYEDIRKGVTTSLNTKAYFDVTFLKNFKFTTNVSYEYTGYNGTTYYTPTIGDGQSFNGRSTKTARTENTINTTQLLSYSNVFEGAHSFDAKIGHEYYLYTNSYFEGQKTKFFDPANPELVNGGEMQYIESYTQKHNMEGFFAMADYNYSSKYYASVAYRCDGTSRFLKRWGHFWSIGAAWRLTGESWAQDAKSWLTDLKFRASYGTQGNESGLNFTPYTDLYAVSWDGSALGYSQSFYGNPNLTWESQNTADVGVDFRLWDRVYGSLDYYHVINDGMLFKRPTATSTGRPYNWENIGKMKSRGLELELNVDIFKKRDLRWTVGIVAAHNDVYILTLPEENRADGITSDMFKLMEGKRRYEYFTYQYAGMNEKGSALWYKDEEKTITAEDGTTTTVVEKVTTDKYSDATKYWIGKEALPFINGGLNTSFYFKGIDFSLQTSFQIGGWGYDSEYLSGMSNSFYVGHHKDLWKTFNPATGEGNLPIWNANNASNSYRQTSDAHLISASYFAIKNITLGYTFPQKWMSKAHIQALRIFAVADNCCLASARRGYDPRINLSGSNNGTSGYSPMKTISGGVQITF